MYKVQARYPEEGSWRPSMNIEGNYPTAHEAEAAVISFGFKGVSYRIVSIKPIMQLTYHEPKIGGWETTNPHEPG